MSPTFRAGFSQRAYAGPQISAGALSGTVTRTSDSAGVSGVVIQRFNSGGTLQGTATTNGSGVYSFTTATFGDLVRCHPPLQYCVADAGEFTVNSSVQNFSIQDPSTGTAWRAVDYAGSGITNQTTIENYWINSLNTRSTSLWSPSSGSITANATGGPTSAEAVEYGWIDRSASPCTGSEVTVAYQPRIFGINGVHTLPTPTLVSGEIWYRMKDWYSTNFHMGNATCALTTATSYKHMLIQFESGSKLCRLGAYFGGGTGTNVANFPLVIDWTGSGVGSGTSNNYPSTGITNFGNISNSWNVWVWGITGIGGPNATASFYRNGTLIFTIPSRDMINPNTIGSGWAITMELGSNMNHGPDQVQQRRIADFGLWPTRPSLL